jgi:hypothetical protein
MPRYRITSGTFRDADDTVKGVGAEIEMGEDIARQHASSLELLDAPAPAPETPEAPAAA